MSPKRWIFKNVQFKNRGDTSRRLIKATCGQDITSKYFKRFSGRGFSSAFPRLLHESLYSLWNFSVTETHNNLKKPIYDFLTAHSFPPVKDIPLWRCNDVMVIAQTTAGSRMVPMAFVRIGSSL